MSEFLKAIFILIVAVVLGCFVAAILLIPFAEPGGLWNNDWKIVLSFGYLAGIFTAAFIVIPYWGK